MLRPFGGLAVVFQSLFCCDGEERPIYLKSNNGYQIPTQPPTEWVSGAVSWWVKWRGHEADHSPSNYGQENVGLYTHSPIHVHGVVLN
jgi:hypothetical protein